MGIDRRGAAHSRARLDDSAEDSDDSAFGGGREGDLECTARGRSSERLARRPSQIGRYRVGDGETRLHLGLERNNRVTPIWDVIGRIRGSEEPDKLVILSNHHDAW